MNERERIDRQTDRQTARQTVWGDEGVTGKGKDCESRAGREREGKRQSQAMQVRTGERDGCN